VTWSRAQPALPQYSESVTGVFVNYRSADEPIAAEAIYRDLAANFGPENIFLDKQAILPGVPYPSKIRTWISGELFRNDCCHRTWLAERTR
jgi:hypothetical protein